MEHHITDAPSILNVEF